MRVATLSLVGAALLSACASLGGPGTGNAKSPPLQFVDLTDDYSAVWDRSQGMEDASRAQALREHFSSLLPGFYDSKRLRFSDPAEFDQVLALHMKRFPARRQGVEDVSRRFAEMLEPAQRSFEAEFGPMTDYPPIYLVDSHGEFDGGMRTLPEGKRLLFGADMIARLHGGHNVRPFFHHELFHLYHSRTFSGCGAIWCSLWSEGLATYVAAKLNPQATDAELLLTWPAPLRPAVERERNAAVCSTLKKLGSEEGKDQNVLFSNGKPEEPNLPSRYGYYVGYLLAIEAGKSRSLRQLAQLGAEDVRPLVEQSLRSLAECRG